MADVVVDEPLYGELDLEWEILVGHEIYTEDCDWLMAHLHARGQLEQPGLGRGAEQDGCDHNRLSGQWTSWHLSRPSEGLGAPQVSKATHMQARNRSCFIASE